MLSSQALSQLKTDELISKFYSSLTDGLTPAMYEKNLMKYGSNSISSQEVSWFKVLLGQFNIFIYLLFFSIGLSIYNREYFDATFIFGFIFFDIVLGFIQEFKAEKTILKLNQLTEYHTVVLRNKMKQTVPHKELVPGDLVFLKSGDLVPADIKIINSEELFLDESIFSGSSQPVFKTHAEDDILLSGTQVLKGNAFGVVYSTGQNTKLGIIEKNTSRKKLKTANLSINEIETEKISKFIFKIVAITLFLTVLYQFFYDLGDFTEFLIFAIALGISVTPEALPLIITYSLSKGAEKLYQNKLIVKKLNYIEDLGAIEVLCADKTGTLTENSLKIANHVSFNTSDVMKLAYFTVTKSLGTDSFDEAILTGTNIKVSYKNIMEIPFDPKKKLSGKVILFRDKYLLIYKGSYDAISRFDHISDSDREKLKKFNKNETSKGRRVLLLAYKYISKFEPGAKVDDSKMNIGGAISFEDPLKLSVYESLKKAQNLNIDLKILSGDSKEICFYTSEKVGLITSIEDVLSFDELQKLSKKEQENAIFSTKVFSGLTPENKVFIIEVLKRKFNVGYLGEGVNDAGALKVANLGIAVSNSCDIARSAADVIITKKSLNVLIDGITEGRKVFYNISKYIKITFSADFGNYFAVLSTSFFSSFLPLKPIQVLLLTFMSDVPLLTVASDNVDQEQLRKPIKSEFSSLAKVFITLGLLSSAFDFMVFFYFYNSGEQILQSSWFLVSIMTEIFVIFSLRTNKFFLRGSLPSKTIVFTSVLMIITSLSLVYIPFLGERFGFVPLSLMNLALVFVISIVYLFCSEVLKIILRNKFDVNYSVRN